MPKKNIKKRHYITQENGSEYFLKLVVYLIIGSLWLRIEQLPTFSIPIPLGLILGLVLTTHETFQIDKKIEYAMLLIVSFVAFWLPLGIVINI